MIGERGPGENRALRAYASIAAIFPNAEDLAHRSSYVRLAEKGSQWVLETGPEGGAILARVHCPDPEQPRYINPPPR
jgi:hypothetical protein